MSSNWITDENNNMASVDYWGSEEAARASLETLRDCTGCINCRGCSGCSYCSYCRDCSDCSGCIYCSYCRDCSGCSYCSYCDLTNPHHFLPVSDPRRYTWIAIYEDGRWLIYAGCRVKWRIQEARAHWLSDDYNGPESVKETVGFALDWIEQKGGER